MQDNQLVQDIRDSIELLNLLDQLSIGLSTAQTTTETVPWRGIGLIFSQVKEKLLRCEDALTLSEVMNSEPSFSSVNSASPVVRKKTLADRIQQSPITPSRVRELITNTSTTIGTKNSVNSEQADN